jgi:hypothetical protein
MRWWWIPVGLVILLFFVRLVLPSQLDDVNPLMGCSEEELELGDVYFVVPKFDGVVIDKEWCDGILAMGRDVELHGVYHSYAEFGVIRSEAYFNEGVDIFKECFGIEPKRFKPGNLKWNSGNDWIMNKVEVELRWNQIFHKVYHCGDTGYFPNWFIRVF